MNAQYFGTDLKIMPYQQTKALQIVKDEADLTTVNHLANLQQAIWLRLITPQGDLTHLGHPDFGSRLHLLIGRLIKPQTLALAEAYIREALRQEERIARIDRLAISQDIANPNTLQISLSVIPIDSLDTVKLNLALSLEGEAVEVNQDAKP